MKKDGKKAKINITHIVNTIFRKVTKITANPTYIVLLI